MSESNLTKKVLVVDAMAPNKSVIKFTGDETWYEISQKVQGYDLVKYGIKSGASVDVTFDPANQVVFLKAQQGNTTAQPATEAPKTTAGDTKLWTVKAVAKNKKVIKFEESTEAWDKVSAEVEKLDLAGLGIVPKAKVLVTFDANNVVTAISKAAEEAATSTDTPPDTSTYDNSNTTNTSIEKQVVLKEAGAIVRSLIEMAREETNSIENVKTVLKDIMKAGLEAMKQ